jgi:hypothetical protein
MHTVSRLDICPSTLLLATRYPLVHPPQCLPQILSHVSEHNVQLLRQHQYGTIPKMPHHCPLANGTSISPPIPTSLYGNHTAVHLHKIDSS